MNSPTASIEWRQAPGEFESLAVALRAVLTAHGVAVDYDELVSVLGLGAATVAVKGEPDASRWACHARDVFLMESAALYGLRLRELHPPDAAAGLDRSAEFAAHFLDSYAPLIRRALAHGQVVLAWRGWDANEFSCVDEWGVILREKDAYFEGFAGNCGGRITVLWEAAEQVYLVEACEPVTCTHDALQGRLSACARHSVAYWEGVESAGAESLFGPVAFEHWRLIERKATADIGDAWMVANTADLVLRVSAARRCLASWLRAASHHVSPHRAAAAREAAVAAESEADSLERVATRSGASDPQAQRIERCREHDERLIERLRILTSE